MVRLSGQLFEGAGRRREVSPVESHPPVDDHPLPRSRARLFWTVVASFVLIFMPVPIRTNVGAMAKPQVEATSVER